MQKQHEETMIALTGLSKQYDGLTALDSIHLQVKKAEIFGIIGKSGAGKSTLIRCVNLLEKPSQGTVIVNQQSLTTLSRHALRAARRKMGMIFQHFNLLSCRTVYDNIALPLEFCNMSKKAIAHAINPLIELTGLSDKKSNYPNELSGGQKQRVAIARALACKPTVLLSDEATSALDPETTHLILQLLKNIRDTLNLTILLITHEMSVIKACCDKVGILDKGKLVEQNEVGEFFAHPNTPIAKNFIVSSLPQTLPAAIADHVLVDERLNTHPVLRLWFFGDAATQPIVGQLINQFKLRINILQAQVESIKKHIMGILIVAVDGDKTQVTASIAYLKQLGIQVEVLGYVPNDIIPFA